MTMVQTIGMASERVLHCLATGRGIADRGYVGQIVDWHILAAEEADLHWDARLRERWLGQYFNAEDDESELDRVAIIGRIDGRWFAATSIIDGGGIPHLMSNHRTFDTRHEAEKAFKHAR